MAKTCMLRSADRLMIRDIAGECRELGDDPHIWRTHFASRLGGLIGADLVFCVETAGCRGNSPRDLGVAEWGWENGFNRSGWIRALTEFHADPFYSLGLQHYFRRFQAQDGAACTRLDLIPNRQWERSFDREVVHRVIGIDHVAWCFRTLDGTLDEQAGVIATREVGSREFGAKQKAMLAEMQEVMARLIGGPLARFAEPAPSDLPLRSRQVLRCLLEGDSDKQAALRLGISRLTVNVYTKQIFRHFHVQSRTELLARWIRRGWSVGRWDAVDSVDPDTAD